MGLLKNHLTEPIMQKALTNKPYFLKAIFIFLLLQFTITAIKADSKTDELKEIAQIIELKKPDTIVRSVERLNFE